MWIKRWSIEYQHLRMHENETDSKCCISDITFRTTFFTSVNVINLLWSSLRHMHVCCPGLLGHSQLDDVDWIRDTEHRQSFRICPRMHFETIRWCSGGTFSTAHDADIRYWYLVFLRCILPLTVYIYVHAYRLYLNQTTTWQHISAGIKLAKYSLFMKMDLATSVIRYRQPKGLTPTAINADTMWI